MDGIYLKARSAAAVAEMSERKFLYMVQDGLLPRPVKIAGMTRWRHDELIAAFERLAAESKEAQA